MGMREAHEAADTHEKAVAHRWQPITGLSDADLAAASVELEHLLGIWGEVRQDLPEQQVLDFNRRLQREWAIETGIIERLYTLDVGTTRLLIEQGIDASLIPHDDANDPPELVAGMIADHLNAVQWLFDAITREQPLSTSFVKQLHQLMTRKQSHAAGVDQFGRAVRVELLHGQYKQHPNNPTKTDGRVHEYCPPEHVASEMEHLVELSGRHLRDGVPPDVASAWLHHRFVQIHPFQDGNGRVARALASLVLIKAGMFPLVVTDRDRDRYMRALSAADSGDMHPLTALVARLQKKWLIQALGIAGTVQRDAQHLDQMLESIGESFKRRDRASREELAKAEKTAGILLRDARTHFGIVAARLGPQLASDVFKRRVSSHSAGDDAVEQRSYFRYQVVDTARRLGYYANLSAYHSWVRLLIETEQGRSEVLLSLHGINREYRGLIAASMCFFRRQSGDTAEPHIIELRPVADDLFQINYHEDAESVRDRFQPWLKDAVVNALDQFRRGE